MCAGADGGATRGGVRVNEEEEGQEKELGD